MSSFEPFWCPLWSVIESHKSPLLTNTDGAGQSYQILQNNVLYTSCDALVGKNSFKETLTSPAKRRDLPFGELWPQTCYVKMLFLGSYQCPQNCRKKNRINTCHNTDGKPRVRRIRTCRHREVQDLTRQLFRWHELYSQLLLWRTWSHIPVYWKLFLIFFLFLIPIRIYLFFCLYWYIKTQGLLILVYVFATWHCGKYIELLCF